MAVLLNGNELARLHVFSSFKLLSLLLLTVNIDAVQFCFACCLLYCIRITSINFVEIKNCYSPSGLEHVSESLESGALSLSSAARHVDFHLLRLIYVTLKALVYNLPAFRPKIVHSYVIEVANSESDLGLHGKSLISEIFAFYHLQDIAQGRPGRRGHVHCTPW